ncbi:hypothetical protein IWQ62_001713, partial [Dispira parvispora]
MTESVSPYILDYVVQHRRNLDRGDWSSAGSVRQHQNSSKTCSSDGPPDTAIATLSKPRSTNQPPGQGKQLSKRDHCRRNKVGKQSMKKRKPSRHSKPSTRRAENQKTVSMTSDGPKRTSAINPDTELPPSLERELTPAHYKLTLKPSLDTVELIEHELLQPLAGGSVPSP